MMRTGRPSRTDPIGWGAYGSLALGLVLAILLFGYSTYRLLDWAYNLLAGQGRWAAASVAAILAVAILLAGLRWCCFFAMAVLNHRRAIASPDCAEAACRWPTVSILAPALNEGETIDAALASLLRIDYPRFEVIVVDDGSTDATLERARRYQGCHGHCIIRVFTKPNGGKWSALNYAFRRSNSELVLCVDADSRLEPQALRRLVERMHDPHVTAVAGQVRVRNRSNLITRLQGLEYVIANGLIRMAQSLSGTVLVVPGPIGLFRRAALEEVYLRFGSGLATARRAGEVEGPFEGDTFAEDFDLSLAILSLGGRVVYEPRAVSHTKAPESVMRLLNQRYRWGRGTVQVLRKFCRRARSAPEMFHPRLAAWLAVTYFAELLVLPAVSVVAIVFFAAYLTAGADPTPLLMWAAAFMLVNLNTAAFFTALHEDTPSMLLALPFYDLYHNLLLSSGWLIAAIDEARGARMRW